MGAALACDIHESQGGGRVTDQIGRRFGNYTATKLLGEGGFGAVYLAEHPYVARKAAVKVLHTLMARDSELVARFFNEARAASAIRHPNIVEVFDAGLTEDGMPYILMELLEGESLKDRVARLGKIPPADAIRYVCDTASALEAAHRAGIVHRDLKPENIFLVPAEGRTRGEQVKILDFGIAKLSGTMANDMVRTQIGQFMGSPVYMSPEQWLAAGDIDRRTDVYSLGVILFELMAGRPPFTGDSPFELRELHLQAPVPTLRSLGVPVPPAAEQVIKRAMAKRPADRYGDMSEVLAAFGMRPSEPVAVGMGAQAAAERSTPSEGRDTRTTLSSGTGEMHTADDAPGDEVPMTGGKRRLAVLGSLSIAAVAVIVLVVARPRSASQSASPEARSAEQLRPVEPAPKPAPPTTPPAAQATPPTPALVEKPAQAPRVTVRLRSQPPGASVIDTATGKALGKTPFDRSFPAGEAPHRLRVLKRGFAGKVLEIGAGLDEDVVLDREKVNERPEDVIL
jgi:serine/threonine protein kinase